jgi:hypothetical protein
MEREREHMHTILTGGRGRRRGLGLALCTAALAIGLMGVGTGTASAVTCAANASSLSAKSYTINGTTTYSDLRGNVNPGDVVVANFTVSPTCSNSLTYGTASYAAPGPTWDPNTSTSQLLWDSTTATGSPGVPTSTLPISVPPFCFQVDFFGGAVLSSLDYSAGQTYSQQGRLVSADNGDPGCTPIV